MPNVLLIFMHKDVKINDRAHKENEPLHLKMPTWYIVGF